MDPFDVVAAADEGQRDHVDVLRERPAQVPLVLLAHGGNGHGNPGQVDSLVVGNRTRDDHFAEHLGGRDLQGPQPHLAVVDQDLIARFHVPGETLESGGAAFLGAKDVLDGDGEAVPPLQVVLLVVDEPAETDLRSLEICQDTHCATSDPGGFAYGIETAFVLVVIPVAHVETSDIHSGVYELNETVGRVYGRTQSTNDLCSTHAATLPHDLNPTSPRAGRVQGPAAAPI